MAGPGLSTKLPPRQNYLDPREHPQNTPNIRENTPEIRKETLVWGIVLGGYFRVVSKVFSQGSRLSSQRYFFGIFRGNSGSSHLGSL